MTFVYPRLMRWNNNSVTDHNRAALSIDVERIEKKQRMADGTMRKFVIADKRTFSTSWTMLPKVAEQTVDGYWGGEDIESFYTSTSGSFPLEISDADNDTTTYTVMFSNFSRNIVKRGTTDFWEISVSMEEV
jgi:hypothetical protein